MRKRQTDAERIEARRLCRQKYNCSPKGKATAKAYWSSDAGRLVSRTFDQGEKRKVLKKKYIQSDSGKSRKAIWDRTYNLAEGNAAKRAIRRNSEHHREVAKKYVQAHRGMYASSVAVAKANRLKRTPKWVTSEDRWVIREIYALAALRTKLLGFTWHVDHIIPLQGKNVSGLHVPANLNVIPARENQMKHNKYSTMG